MTYGKKRLYLNQSNQIETDLSWEELIPSGLWSVGSCPIFEQKYALSFQPDPPKWLAVVLGWISLLLDSTLLPPLY
jgi:hypothetical protein